MKEETSILIVDDEPDLLDNIGLALEAEGYCVLTASDGIKALEILESEPVDLILADVAMPGMNGYQLYERLCENPKWALIPFIFLSARTMDTDIRYGKELGVDDYLTKPVRSADLLAVVRGKLRRAQHLAGVISKQSRTSSNERLLSVGHLRIDSGQHRVWLDEAEVKLSAREFIVLEKLAQQEGNIVSPQELIQETHQLNTDHIEAGALLRPLILSLRRKLGSATGEMGFIENVRGVGYRLVVPEE